MSENTDPQQPPDEPGEPGFTARSATGEASLHQPPAEHDGETRPWSSSADSALDTAEDEFNRPDSAEHPAGEDQARQNRENEPPG